VKEVIAVVATFPFRGVSGAIARTDEGLHRAIHRRAPPRAVLASQIGPDLLRTHRSAEQRQLSSGEIRIDFEGFRQVLDPLPLIPYGAVQGTALEVELLSCQRPGSSIPPRLGSALKRSGYFSIAVNSRSRASRRRS